MTLLIFSVVFYSCHQDDFIASSDLYENEILEEDFGSMTELGEKLSDPYTVKNMQDAYDNIEHQFNSGKKPKVRTTHLYIRYAPDSEEELSILKLDSSLILYEYPLDVEIKKRGDYYHDPSIPKGKPTYQYTVVKTDYKYPQNLKHKILKRLYIPEEDEEITELNRSEADSNVEILLQEAFSLSGRKLEPIDNQLNRSRWRPSGVILAHDDFLTFNNNSSIPIEGLKVKARRYYTTYIGFTNSMGKFSVNGTFKRPANYCFEWERYDFSIRSGGYGQAGYNGPKIKGDWNLDIPASNTAQKLYATIFRASFAYYYGNRNGLRRPPENSTWNTQLKIGAYQQNGTSNHCVACGYAGIGSRIKIYKDAHSRLDYATTIHELAHASHWHLGNISWGSIEPIVKESWATGVAWSLTNNVYSNYQPPFNYGEYTLVVKDMIDPVYGYDNVTGYTIRQIEDALLDEPTWTGWRDNIKNKYNNATESYLDQLFRYWD